MYISAFDSLERCLLSWRFTGESKDHEWQQLYDDVLLLDAEATRQNSDSLLILVLEENSGRPNPTWRKKFAELRKIAKAPKQHAVLVMDSALLRGALMAINWIVPTPPHEEIFVCKTFEEAIEWVEQKRKQTLPVLQSLKTQILLRMEESSQR